MNPRALYDRLFAAARTAEAKRAQAERLETRRSVGLCPGRRPSTGEEAGSEIAIVLMNTLKDFAG